MRRITRKEFMRWLEQQPPRTKFRRANACRCPLATFAGAIFGPLDYGNGDAEYKTPAWARGFMLAVDEPFPTKRWISAREALTLLARR